MENELKFKGINSEGVETEYETIFTFESPETKKNYIVYTDNTTDEENNVKVYASIYDPKSLKMDDKGEFGTLNLTPVETEKEWTIIAQVLQQVEDDLKAK